jgi:exonuclease III
MKIATFNVNSINKRLANLLQWLEAEEPDAALDSRAQGHRCKKRNIKPFGRVIDPGTASPSLRAAGNQS